uniref:Gfo/idh/MocA family oxidoreductase n=1 Tax=Papaver somniferum TaxID=3469 RepID=A0A5B7LJS5_PAPSO|nr:gfo/idh/MocA family oxidoreductase [Papaver somniferum]
MTLPSCDEIAGRLTLSTLINSLMEGAALIFPLVSPSRRRTSTIQG